MWRTLFLEGKGEEGRWRQWERARCAPHGKSGLPVLSHAERGAGSRRQKAKSDRGGEEGVITTQI